MWYNSESVCISNQYTYDQISILQISLLEGHKFEHNFLIDRL